MIADALVSEVTKCVLSTIIATMRGWKTKQNKEMVGGGEITMKLLPSVFKSTKPTGLQLE